MQTLYVAGKISPKNTTVFEIERFRKMATVFERLAVKNEDPGISERMEKMAEHSWKQYFQAGGR